MRKISIFLIILLTVIYNSEQSLAQYGAADASQHSLEVIQPKDQEINERLSADLEDFLDLDFGLYDDGDSMQDKNDLLGQTVLAGPQDISSLEIVRSIEVLGNQTVGITTILARIKTRVGEPYIPSIISDDIKRLYNTGFFVDVSVEKKEYDRGVQVVIHLKEKPIINNIVFPKTRHFSNRTLALRIKSRKGQFFDRRTVREDIRIIRDLYARRGLTSASVDFDVEIDENNKATITFDIQEGERIKIKRIIFSGNDTFNRRRLMRVIKTRHDTLFTSGFLKEDIIVEDLDRIRSFYASEGFLDASVSYSFEQAPKSRLILYFHIEENKRYYTGNISIQGNDVVFSDEEILGMMQDVKPGNVFTPMRLASDIARIRESYFDRGYIFCQVNDFTAVSPETGKVDIRLDIIERDIAYINRIHVQGNIRTRDIVIRRELRMVPGDAFDGGKLRRSKERLQNLGFFEEIDYDVRDTQIPNSKDLVVQVKEAKTGSLSFGGGYSTVDKLIGFVEISQRNFDFTNWPSFTGGGQDLSIRAEMGTVRNNMRLSFTEPWIYDYPISGGFDVYQNTIDKDSGIGYAYSEKRLGGNLRFGKQFSEYISGGMIYRMEEITIKDVSATASQDLRDEEGKNRVSTLGFHATYDSRDSIFSPTRGLVVGGGADVAGGFLGGDKDFYRLTGRGSYHIPLFGGTVLEFRMRAGIVDSYGDTSEVPIYERFFAGGAYTIRGYNERKVGPLDSVTQDPIGGEAMLVGNVEYTVPIVDFIKVAAFFDTGNVWRRIEDFGQGGYKSGMGLGLRVRTPIGPINLDYGYPLNDEPGEDKRSGKFYFSVSRSF